MTKNSSPPENGAPGIFDLIQRLAAFRDARAWRRFHSLKNLSASLAIEAGEILELTQWKDDAEAEALLDDEGFRRRLADECADVFSYLLLICEKAGIDLAAATAAKIDTNERRYPVAMAKGNALKYNEF